MSELLVNTIKKADGTGSLSVPAESGTVVTTASPSLGRRNLIINGAMQVAQRGTSFTGITSGQYCLDRWYIGMGGSSSADISQVAFTNGQTDVDGFPEYYQRVDGTTGGLSNSQVSLRQRVENVTALGGKTITLTFWAKADSAKTIAIEFVQTFGLGGTQSSNVIVGYQNVNITTSWQKFEVTQAIPSITGKTIGSVRSDYTEFTFWLDAGSGFNSRTGSIGAQSLVFDIANVQLEVGSVATPFEHRSYGEELELCKRYYALLADSQEGTNASGICYCCATGSTALFGFIQFPVEMRSAPTLDTTVSDFRANLGSVNDNSTTAPSISNVSTKTCRYDQGGFSALSADVSGIIRVNGGTGQIALDAEL